MTDSKGVGSNSIDALAGRSLGDLLDQIERLLARLDGTSPQIALDIFALMDQASARFVQRRSSKISMAAEEAQWEYIQKSVERNAGVFLAAVGGPEALAAARQKHQVSSKQWWWFVDEEVHQKRTASAQKAWRAGLLVVLALILAGLIYQAFLAPDPQVVAAYRVQQTAIYQIAIGEPRGALQNVETVLADQPANPELLVFRAVLLEMTGQNSEANQAFEDARAAFPDEEQFLLTRASYYLQAGEPQKGLVDAEELLKRDPKSAEGAYLIGKALEILGQYDEAITAYQRAGDLAELTGNTSLEATIKVNLATMMQAGPPAAVTQPASP